MDQIEFGKRLRQIREKYLPELSLNKAAQMALIGHSQLTNIEEGKVDPRMSTIFRIAESWNVPIEEFFATDKRKSRKP